MAKELLLSNPEAAAQLQRLEAAAKRVADLQAAQAELMAAMQQVESEQEDASDMLEAQVVAERDAETAVVAAQRAVEEAELQLLSARIQRSKWTDQVDDALERIESGKAAAVAAAAGTAASLPLAVTGGLGPVAGLLGCGTVLLTCLLFGVTYRYALRQDVNNTQLKGGVVAAFGLARALGAADVIQNTAAEAGVSPFSLAVIAKGALFAGESMLAVGFAAMAVEYAFSTGFVKPFGAASGGDSAAPSE